MKNPEEKDLLFMIKTLDSINTDKQIKGALFLLSLGKSAILNSSSDCRKLCCNVKGSQILLSNRTFTCITNCGKCRNVGM